MNYRTFFSHKLKEAMMKVNFSGIKLDQIEFIWRKCRAEFSTRFLELYVVLKKIRETSGLGWRESSGKADRTDVPKVHDSAQINNSLCVADEDNALLSSITPDKAKTSASSHDKHVAHCIGISYEMKTPA